jgi:hypothetical protein
MITPATLGSDNFVHADSTIISFVPSMRLESYFREAYAGGTITSLMCLDDEVARYLTQELARSKISVKTEGT